MRLGKLDGAIHAETVTRDPIGIWTFTDGLRVKSFNFAAKVPARADDCGRASWLVNGLFA